MDANIDLIFNIKISKNISISIIDNIEITENRIDKDYSLIIYIVKPGDTLWNIAKNMRSTVDDIVRANNIENENLIKAGEKLYIPKNKNKK